MPDLGGGHELEHRVNHPKTGSEDRHEADALAELSGLHLLDRGPDRERPHPRVGQGLITE
jgi:hypothetical protein